MSQARTPERWGGKEGERVGERRDEPRLKRNEIKAGYLKGRNSSAERVD